MTGLLHDLRLAWASAVAAMGSGAATVMEWIPDDIGKPVSLAGLILTIVLIRLHWRNGNARYKQVLIENDQHLLKNRQYLLQNEKILLEIEALKEKIS